jgi:hypothetical protein
MMAVAIITLSVIYAGTLIYIMRYLKKAQDAEGLRLYMLADNALSYLKASNLQEKVQATAVKQQYDVQLAYLRDTMAKADKQEKDKHVPGPAKAKTADGHEIDLDEYEVMS